MQVTFKNLSISFRILLKLSVSMSTGKKSSSKLQHIKTYLRSTMKNERICGLIMIPIEHEFGQKLKEKELVSDFV